MRDWSRNEEDTAVWPDVRSRAVRMVLDHREEHGSQWGAIYSVLSKIGYSGETLRDWVRQAERGAGLLRRGPTSNKRERVKSPERGARELGQASKMCVQ